MFWTYYSHDENNVHDCRLRETRTGKINKLENHRDYVKLYKMSMPKIHVTNLPVEVSSLTFGAIR